MFGSATTRSSNSSKNGSSPAESARSRNTSPAADTTSPPPPMTDDKPKPIRATMTKTPRATKGPRRCLRDGSFAPTSIVTPRASATGAIGISISRRVIAMVTVPSSASPVWWSALRSAFAKSPALAGRSEGSLAIADVITSAIGAGTPYGSTSGGVSERTRNMTAASVSFWPVRNGESPVMSAAKVAPSP